MEIEKLLNDVRGLQDSDLQLTKTLHTELCRLYGAEDGFISTQHIQCYMDGDAAEVELNGTVEEIISSIIEDMKKRIAVLESIIETKEKVLAVL